VFNVSDPQTFWLNVTNIGLGFVTLVCCVIVGRTLVGEIGARLKAHAQNSHEADDHVFLHPELGLTMADGGEKLKPGKKE